MTAPVSLGAFDWQPASWRKRAAAHQPAWPDPDHLERVIDELRRMPPLVFAGEARSLRESLAAVSRGDGFLLHAGDCAESFAEFTADNIRDKLKVILQMSVVLTYSTGVPTVKVGRIAGQFAKPRSAPLETRDGQELPSYFGDIVNDFAFDALARRPDPQRMLRGYNKASATLNLLRAFTKGGFADLNRVHQWNLEFIASRREGRRYEEVADGIERALHFMAACGIDLGHEAQLHEVDFYTSHEALILGFEEALTRRDSLTGDWYDCSAHLLWIGERTRQIDGAHVAFFSGVHNPIGVKLGPSATPADAVELAEQLNPLRIPGRLTFYARMGAAQVRESLPPLLRAVKEEGHPVLWASDPMHGNGIRTATGVKTRRFDAIMAELEGFFEACWEVGVWPGGVHLEFTGEDVTECLGGADDVLEEHL
ncbi:MAG: 3-deoxy-7-phosphoheptulonate synthase, partial [Actinomycetota bacterium]|nr:3-deoxy-7-phosphoheptulonate synthase [Actinomycetota bacterium]